MTGTAVIAAMDAEIDQQSDLLIRRCHNAARSARTPRVVLAKLLLDIAKDYEYLASEDAANRRHA